MRHKRTLNFENLEDRKLLSTQDPLNPPLPPPTPIDPMSPFQKPPPPGAFDPLPVGPPGDYHPPDPGLT